MAATNGAEQDRHPIPDHRDGDGGRALSVLQHLNAARATCHATASRNAALSTTRRLPTGGARSRQAAVQEVDLHVGAPLEGERDAEEDAAMIRSCVRSISPGIEIPSSRRARMSATVSRAQASSRGRRPPHKGGRPDASGRCSIIVKCARPLRLHAAWQCRSPVPAPRPVSRNRSSPCSAGPPRPSPIACALPLSRVTIVFPRSTAVALPASSHLSHQPWILASSASPDVWSMTLRMSAGREPYLSFVHGEPECGRVQAQVAVELADFAELEGAHRIPRKGAPSSTPRCMFS